MNAFYTVKKAAMKQWRTEFNTKNLIITVGDIIKSDYKIYY